MQNRGKKAPPSVEAQETCGAPTRQSCKLTISAEGAQVRDEEVETHTVWGSHPGLERKEVVRVGSQEEVTFNLLGI